MKESHHGRLEMEEGHHGWISLDGSRLEKLRVEHLKNFESVELVERWEVTPVLMKYRLMPRLMILIENNCCGSAGSFMPVGGTDTSDSATIFITNKYAITISIPANRSLHLSLLYKNSAVDSLKPNPTRYRSLALLIISETCFCNLAY